MKINNLKDEINQLKWEKGRPKILPKVPDCQNKTQKEKPKKWHKDSKKTKIQIDRTEYIIIDKFILPADAQHGTVAIALVSDGGRYIISHNYILGVKIGSAWGVKFGPADTMGSREVYMIHEGAKRIRILIYALKTGVKVTITISIFYN